MRFSAVVGVAAVVLGLVVVLQRGLAGLFDLTYVFVTGAGVLALVQGVRYANDARTADRRAIETGDPEDRYEVPVPGAETDALVSARGFSRASVKRRREFRARLRRVAVETLRARGDYADDAVEAAVDGGRWTDDPVAAWFVGDDVPAPTPVRLRRFLGSDVEFRFGVARTVDALAAARSGDSPDRTVATPSRSVRLVAGARRRLGAARDTLAGVRR
ncbi:DUF7269 family protein [Halobaculum lipolyticum]|uniref:Uncharacterized protein n=1 Tax=Halobaculum lipolyticum TaxID=3032001 RepID=A0ABD5WDI5_9EURY|nr:hypothetical protein [Halobaculum sp. DT31]